MMGTDTHSFVQVERVYTACSEFTAGYVCAFMNLDVTVRFMPLDHVTRGDCVHKACCSWHKAQEIILAGLLLDVYGCMCTAAHFNTPGTGGAGAGSAKVDALMKQDVSHLSYEELLGLHCARFAGSVGAATGGPAEPAV
jgi:hypothetical protein